MDSVFSRSDKMNHQVMNSVFTLQEKTKHRGECARQQKQHQQWPGNIRYIFLQTLSINDCGRYTPLCRKTNQITRENSTSLIRDDTIYSIQKNVLPRKNLRFRRPVPMGSGAERQTGDYERPPVFLPLSLSRHVLPLYGPRATFCAFGGRGDWRR